MNANEKSKYFFHKDSISTYHTDINCACLEVGLVISGATSTSEPVRLFGYCQTCM